MTKGLFLLGITLSSLLCFAQDYSITWGPDCDNKGGVYEFPYVFIGEENNYLFVLETGKKKTLHVFDTKGNLVESNQLVFPEKDIEVNGNLKLKDSYFATLHVDNKKVDKRIIYASKLDNGKLSSSLIKIAELPVSLGGFAAAKDELRKFYKEAIDQEKVVVSKNEEFAAIVHETTLKNDSEEFNVVVLNGKLEKKWEKVFTLSEHDRNLRIAESFVSNEGTVVVGARYYKNLEDRKKENSRFEYRLYMLSAGDLEEFAIDLGENLVPTNARIIDADSRKIRFGGFYGKRSGEKYSHKGVFLCTINQNGQTEVTIEPFTKDFLEMVVPKNQIDKNPGVSLRLKLKDSGVLEDGTINLISEWDYTFTPRYEGATSQHISKSIYVFSFSDKLSFLGHKTIPKGLRALYTSYSSFVGNEKGNDLYFVYNDKGSKEERQDAKASKKYQFITFGNVSIVGTNGDIKTKLISNSKESGKHIRISACSTIRGKKFILFNVGKSKFQLGVLELQ